MNPGDQRDWMCECGGFIPLPGWPKFYLEVTECTPECPYQEFPPGSLQRAIVKLGE